MELRRALVIEEQFWKQKSRIKWLAEGDKNSRYFHPVVKERQVQSVIHRIKNSQGQWISSEKEIGDEATHFFSDLFTAKNFDFDTSLDVIPCLINDADNLKLENIPTIEEVQKIVFEMDGNSAARPDEFTEKFFQVAWDIVETNIYEQVLNFFCGADIPRGITSTFIVLIPKVSNPQDFTQYRPISLCNFINKLFFKDSSGQACNFALLAYI